MPVATNKFYNDPSLGAAIGNLSSLFAPPSGADASGWANANATRAKAAAIADLFANPNQSDFDRKNVAIGNYSPTSSYYAVDQNNATTQRGQDVTASTSRANTTDTLANDRYKFNNADVMLTPNTSTILSPERAKTMGTPQGLAGGVQVGSGQSFTSPLGVTTLGPRTTDQVLAENEKRLIDTGKLTDQDLRDRIMAPAREKLPQVVQLQNQRANLIASGVPSTDQRVKEIDDTIAASGRGATADSFTDAAAKKQAADFAAIAEEGGPKAQQMVSDIQQLGELGRTIKTGKLAEAKLKIGPYAQAFGINVEGLPEAQAYDAIVQRMAPNLRVKGSGAQSDLELGNFLKSIPNIGNTPEGNALVQRTMQGLTQNKIKAAAIANNAINGRITRQEASDQIAALGDPLTEYRDYTSQSNGRPPVDAAAPVANEAATPGVTTAATNATPTALTGVRRRYNPATGKIE